MAQRFSLFENSIFHSEIIAFSYFVGRLKSFRIYQTGMLMQPDLEDDMNFKTKSKLKIKTKHREYADFHDS